MLSEAESRSIELSRFVAMTLIVSCHVLQAYDNKWAFVLNVGVQMFFLLSGYLYGTKDSLEWKAFVKGRLVKVHIPYCLFLFFAFPILYFLNSPIKWSQVIIYFLNLQAFISPIEGLNHLWFLSILMVGYGITPIIRRGWQKNKYLLLAILCIVCLVEYGFVQKMYIYFSWILVYVIGLLLGMSDKIHRLVIFGSSLIGFVVSVVLIPNISSLYGLTYTHVSVWFHVTLSVIMLGFVYMISKLLTIHVVKRITLLNKISYEIYLVHHLFCLGTMSVLYLTNWNFVNIILMLFITLIIAYGLHRLTTLINKML